jgi:TrmH family RNA methyltransferase
VVLDRLQDPGNAGAVIRTAEAFGASGVILLKGSVHASNPKALRASAGSVFRLPVVEGVNASQVLAFLDRHAVKLYAAMPHTGLTPDASDFRRPCCFAIGSEAHGVEASLSATASPVRIPTQRVESLNAAVAASVLLYEAQRQRKPA